MREIVIGKKLAAFVNAFSTDDSPADHWDIVPLSGKEPVFICSSLITEDWSRVSKLACEELYSETDHTVGYAVTAIEIIFFFFIRFFIFFYFFYHHH